MNFITRIVHNIYIHANILIYNVTYHEFCFKIHRIINVHLIKLI